MTLGSRLTLTITDIAFGGEGVARQEDFVVFVPFVAPGEAVEAEVTEVKKRFARARLLRVVQPSPERVAAALPLFRRMRRLPISAPRLRGPTPAQAQADCRPVPAHRRTRPRAWSPR